jgi:uncharacterized protein
MYDTRMTPERDITTALEAVPEIVFAYLFGSRAAGNAHAASDVDVAVYVRDVVDPIEERLRLLGLLDRALHIDTIDLVVLNTAPLSLAGRILTTRKVLIDRDPPHRHLYESLTARQYADFHFREHRLLNAMSHG